MTALAAPYSTREEAQRKIDESLRSAYPDDKRVDALIAEAVLTYGGIDILINNAGTGSEETIMEADDDRWQYYWDPEPGI